LPTGFSPSQTVGSVFPSALAYPDLGTATLAEALDFPGGSGVEGAARILLRAAVAALLNAAHPDVEYPSIVADVIAAVDAALASGDRSAMLELATQLDNDNNLGCPLGGGAANVCTETEESAVLQLIETACEGKSGREYRKCARQTAKDAARNDVVGRRCSREALRCALRSVLSRPGNVVCLRFYPDGTTRCSLRRSAERCRPPSGGSACVDTEALSCCEADASACP